MKLNKILPYLIAEIARWCPWLVGDRPDTHILESRRNLAKGVEWIVRRKNNGFYERILFEFSQISKDGAIMVAIQFAASPLHRPLIPAGPFGWYGSIIDLEIFGLDCFRELHWSGPWLNLGDGKSSVVRNWEVVLKSLAGNLDSRLEFEERLLSENSLIIDLKSMLCDNHTDLNYILKNHPTVTSVPNWARYIELGENKDNP
ncbi:hypothetical protein SAMN02745166_05148 [Prosthecobacter debontii]|uniref:Uncharacterized protein n=1 Tax=Prosthecobacter debontii TaxID=48467 RepID=A0A1T4Z5X0_9BACT|nr:hypothetical protein [Prosthecobacter debontii]SKB09457.1 hypothetical protein SAMN02745166_05148 [Prosthecobacter debontii]